VPLTVAFLGEGAVGVQGVGDAPGDLLEQGRVQFAGLLHQELLDPLLVLGLDCRRQRVDRGRDDPGMRRGDRPDGLGGRDLREHRRQYLPGQPPPRTQIRRGPHPARRLGRADPHQLRQQRRGAATRALMGQTPCVDLGDQRMIHRGQPPPLNLQIPQHRQDIVAGQGGQIQVLQFVDEGAEPRHDRSRNASITIVEHAFNISSSTDDCNRFRLIPKGIQRELIMKPESRGGGMREPPAGDPNRGPGEPREPQAGDRTKAPRQLPPSPPLFNHSAKATRQGKMGPTRGPAEQGKRAPLAVECTAHPAVQR
jgi:hypothetical protein